MRPSADHIFWRYRFQPVWGIWGHLGLDYTFENPADSIGEFLLRHLDYGLPGNRSKSGYRHSIARYSAKVARGGLGWPPLRTPRGFVFAATAFQSAPRQVGEFLMTQSPKFWGSCGAYRRLGPNSNTGLRRTLQVIEAATGYHFLPPPARFRVGGVGWNWRGDLSPEDGPYPGYFDSDRFRFSAPAADS